MDIYDPIAAFTVSELGEILKQYCGVDHQDMPRWYEGGPNDDSVWVVYVPDIDGEDYELVADTEADARAKMLIYLIKNNLIPLNLKFNIRINGQLFKKLILQCAEFSINLIKSLIQPSYLILQALLCFRKHPHLILSRSTSKRDYCFQELRKIHNHETMKFCIRRQRVWLVLTENLLIPFFIQPMVKFIDQRNSLLKLRS
jgi:hypothetical protein